MRTFQRVVVVVSMVVSSLSVGALPVGAADDACHSIDTMGISGNGWTSLLLSSLPPFTYPSDVTFEVTSGSGLFDLYVDGAVIATEVSQISIGGVIGPWDSVEIVRVGDPSVELGVEGTCTPLVPDTDGDGVDDTADNCPGVVNPDQADLDGDGDGDACDPDDDDDGVDDTVDNCPGVVNPDQADFDADGVGDLCDPDIDGDLVANADDVCPGTVLPDTATRDHKRNRYLANSAGEFVDGDGTPSGYTTADTGGCSSAQIVDATGLGQGHLRFGVTRSVLEAWVSGRR